MAHEKYYQQITPDVIDRWKQAVVANPHAQWNGLRIGPLIPFAELVKPRIGVDQSLIAFSIISLEGQVPDEARVVAYGLEPLIATGVLTQEEADRFAGWFTITDPSSGSGFGEFQKVFTIGEITYRLSTDNYGGSRDLNLQVVT